MIESQCYCNRSASTENCIFFLTYNIFAITRLFRVIDLSQYFIRRLKYSLHHVRKKCFPFSWRIVHSSVERLLLTNIFSLPFINNIALYVFPNRTLQFVKPLANFYYRQFIICSWIFYCSPVWYLFAYRTLLSLNFI